MLSLNLDKRHDILYIKINDTSNSYGDETECGIVVLKDITDDTITGVTIFDFAKKCRENRIQELKLPINIDFDRDVYPKLRTC